jgi:hypothetical protein
MFMYLAHFGNKSQCCWKGHYISWVIVSREWWYHFLLVSKTTIAANDRLCQITFNRRLLRIVYVKLCKFEKCYNFRVAFKQNHAERNCINSDLPVYQNKSCADSFQFFSRSHPTKCPNFVLAIDIYSWALSRGAWGQWSSTKASGWTLSSVNLWLD